jgi:hypothetical protein
LVIGGDLTVSVKGLIDFDKVAAFGVPESGGEDFSKFFVTGKASVVPP